MRSTKKIVSVVAAVVMMIGVLALTVSAESIYFTAVDLPSGEQQSIYLESGEQKDFKVEFSRKGTLQIDISSELHFANLFLYDDQGNIIKCEDYEFSLGSGKAYNALKCSWNDFQKSFKCTAKYELEKGTYFISYCCEAFGHQNGNTLLTATYPTGNSQNITDNSDSDSKISYLTLEMEVGDTVKLGAVVKPDDAEVVWSSSKSKVATVSASGKVKAKKEGTTIITAKCGKSVQKIKIIVV